MKIYGKILLALGVAWMLITVIEAVYSDYRYDKTIYSEWKLADKASSIEQKAIKIALFADKLSKAGLEGRHDAIILKTPDNSFNDNFIALKTLQIRLQEIQKMDPSSFEYNIAIQQITEQEQGEANKMLDVFKGCWMLVHYPYLWSWICTLQVIMSIIFCLLAMALIAKK
jgi:hypothetical protein